jgi:RNA polymerase sigma-70 factor (ECF subfamily)
MSPPPKGTLGGIPTETEAVDPHSSVALLLRARKGDTAARDELCARYLPRLQRWAHGRVPPQARALLDTGDIVQDALMRSIRRMDVFQPAHDDAFCAYVCEAIRNRLRDAVRGAARRPQGTPISFDHPTSDPSPLEEAVGSETLARYEAALAGLRPAERELIVARVELGLDYQEIADLTHKPSAAAARMAVGRALIRLGLAMGHEPRS